VRAFYHEGSSGKNQRFSLFKGVAEETRNDS
jgi:hypothetical protein